MLPTTPRLRAARRRALLRALLAWTLLGAAALLVDGWPLRLAIAAGAAAPAAALGWWSYRPWRGRQRVIAARMDEATRALLADRVAFYRALDDAGRRRFEDMLRIFLDEVPIHGIGCTPDEADPMLVAASAIIPVFGFPAWEYDGLRQILLRPEHFDATFSAGREDPLHATGMVADEGLFSGTLILSLPALREGFADDSDGRNVGIHEFAHLVDRASGSIDGLPPGLPPGRRLDWQRLVHAQLDGRGRRILRAYGYQDECEFFAVGSELFFEDPERMRQAQPELHRLMQEVYRQDPRPRRRG